MSLEEPCIDIMIEKNLTSGLQQFCIIHRGLRAGQIRHCNKSSKNVCQMNCRPHKEVYHRPIFEYGKDATISVQCQYEHEHDEGSREASNPCFLEPRVLDIALKSNSFWF